MLRSKSVSEFIDVQGEFVESLPPREEEEKLLTWRKVVPNSLTLLSAFIGLSSVTFGRAYGVAAQTALYAFSFVNLYLSSYAIQVGILDGADGPVARAVSGVSRFGAELDSLCDLINFGVVPGLLIWCWGSATYDDAAVTASAAAAAPSSSPPFGSSFAHLLASLPSSFSLISIWWILGVFWTMATAVRLARFNAGVDLNRVAWSRSYFLGCPSPAGACMAVAPIVVSFRFNFRLQSIYVASYYILCALLMVSNVPTFSSKAVTRRRARASAAVALAILCAASYDVWATCSVMLATYFASLPVSSVLFYRLKREHDQKRRAKARKKI